MRGSGLHQSIGWSLAEPGKDAPALGFYQPRHRQVAAGGKQSVRVRRRPVRHRERVCPDASQGINGQSPASHAESQKYLVRILADQPASHACAGIAGWLRGLKSSAPACTITARPTMLSVSVPSEMPLTSIDICAWPLASAVKLPRSPPWRLARPGPPCWEEDGLKWPPALEASPRCNCPFRGYGCRGFRWA